MFEARPPETKAANSRAFEAASILVSVGKSSARVADKTISWARADL
jgi:hypothetical protein